MQRVFLVLLAVVTGGVLVGLPAWTVVQHGGAPDDGARFDQGPEARRAYEAALEAARAAALRARPAGPVRPDVPEVEPRTRRAPAPGPAQGVTYLVEDPDGEPLAGVPVVLSLLPGELAGRPYRPAIAVVSGDAFLPSGELRVEALSDAAGEVRFEGVPYDRRVRVDVPAQGGFAAACQLGSTRTVMRRSIRLRKAAGVLDLRVEGLPPHEGTACVLIHPAWRSAYMSGPLSHHWTHGILPLDEQGRVRTPPVPAGPLQADVYLPGVGHVRNLAIERLPDGAARVVLPAVETMTLKGRLLDPDGRGVANVRLAVVVRSFLARETATEWLQVARSDDEGRFVFPHAPAGVVDQLYVDAPGFVGPRLVLENVPLRPGETLDVPVQLVPECTATGRVLDAQGRPVAGARVSCRSRWTGMVLLDAPRTWTDAEGRWFVDRLPPGPCTVTVRAGGFSGKTEVEFAVTHDAPAVAPHAWLSKAASSGRVRVQVVGPTGEPVVGATVAYRLRHANTSGRADAGITDAEGRYTLEGIQDELDSFEVWAHKQGAVSRAVPVEVAAIAARAAEVRIELPPVGDVRGTVRVDGEPARGFRVSVVDTRLRGETDGEGVFRIRGVPPGPHMLRVRTRTGGNLGEPQPAVVRTGESTVVELAFSAAPKAEHVLAGSLVNAKGEALVGVRVSAYRDGARGAQGGTWTDEAGAFSIPVPQRGTYEIRNAQRVLLAGASTEAPARIVFDATRLPVVEGRILSHEGTPCAGAEVWVLRGTQGSQVAMHAGGGWYRMELHPTLHQDLRVAIHAMCVDAWGRRLPYGEAGVPFTPGDVVDVRASPRKTDKTPGASAAPASARLVGLVLGSDGKPVPDAVLYRMEGSGGSSIAKTGPDGLFATEGMPSEPIEVTVEAPRGYHGATSARRVRASDGPLRIVLAAMAPHEMFTATLHVKDLDGKPVEGFRLMVGGWMGVTTEPSDADGRIVVERLAREEYEIATRPWADREVKGYEGDPDLRGHDVSVGPENANRTVTLPIRKLDPATQHDVWVTFKDPKGEILADAFPSVTLHGLGDREDIRYTPARRPFGRKEPQVRIPDVPEGRYRVEVTFPGYDPAYLAVKPFEIEVPHAPIEIPLRRAAQVHGRIVHGDIASCRVRFVVVDGDTRTWITRTPSASGHFTFNIDPRLRATLVAYHLTDEFYGLLEDVPASETPVEMKLETKGLAVRGRVTGLKRVPKDYRIRIHGAMLGGTAALAKDGTFALTGLPPGTYDITFETEDVDALVRRPRFGHWIQVDAQAEAGGPVVEIDPLQGD